MSMFLFRFGDLIPVPGKKPLFLRYNNKVDSWSLGLVILECCLGKRPMSCYKGKEEELAEKVTEEIEKIKNKGLRDVVDSVLKLDPNIRSHFHVAISEQKYWNDVDSLFDKI